MSIQYVQRHYTDTKNQIAQFLPRKPLRIHAAHNHNIIIKTLSHSPHPTLRGYTCCWTCEMQLRMLSKQRAPVSVTSYILYRSTSIRKHPTARRGMIVVVRRGDSAEALNWLAAVSQIDAKVSRQCPSPCQWTWYSNNCGWKWRSGSGATKADCSEFRQWSRRSHHDSSLIYVGRLQDRSLVEERRETMYVASGWTTSYTAGKETRTCSQRQLRKDQVYSSLTEQLGMKNRRLIGCEQEIDWMREGLVFEEG